MTADDNLLLSALVDGELTGQELDQAIVLLNTDEQARQQFQRYQLISNQLRGVSNAYHQNDISQRLKQAIDDEPTHQVVITAETSQPTADVLSFPERFWKQAVGLAVAASFGALAVVGTMSMPESQMAPITVSSQTLATAEPTETHRWTVSEQEIEDKLNVYLLDHNEYAGASSIFSDARVIAYDSER